MLTEEGKEKIKDTIKVAAGISIVSTPVLAIGILIGSLVFSASEAKTQQNTEETHEQTQTELSDVIVGNVGPDDIKIFDEGQHYISVRISENPRQNSYFVEGYAINNIPEGYEVYEITPYNSVLSNGSKTNGYDIWFVNTERVEVHASYNDNYEQYGYFTFGEVIEEEKTLTK